MLKFPFIVYVLTLSFPLFISQNKLFKHKKVKQRLSTIRYNSQETSGEIEDNDEENIFEILENKCVALL